MWFIRFLKSNILYIIWFFFYFFIAFIIFELILATTINALITVSIIYGVSLTIALSPIGEVILRLAENCRMPATEQERSYLLPIFEEVYQYAKEINPSLNNGIKIYIMDVMYVNAFAIGRQTIAVTRGALNTFNAEELKGVLAHELGHMTYGHTKALLLTYIGNIFFSLIVFALRLLLSICETISEITARMNVVGIVFMIITFITRITFEIFVFLFINIGDLILSLNSRKNELEADKFAYDVGMGSQMISALYLLQKISINQKLKISEKLKASHPHIADRIGQLERLQNLEYVE